MKKHLMVIFLVGIVLTPYFALAATDTANMQVTASVSAKCRISSVGDINFGEYDPTSSNPKDGDGNITIQCVKRTNYDVYISGTRTMIGPENEQLSFEIYRDAARTQAFPNNSPGITGQAQNSSPIQIGAYGRIPAQQDVGTGNYTRTLTATVSY
ncbi:MAG: spore coat U domain-containing protein [Deltaproteobacteria bacterium]|nr:spore coat U domain-containing protein [Deltaproteobacteria bacterium]